MGERGNLTGLMRTILLLEYLAPRSSGMGFNEIKALFPDAPPSTVSRLLKALLEENLLAKREDEKNYRIGSRARLLGEILCNHAGRTDLLKTAVRNLAETTRHSAAYFELQDWTNRLVVKHEIPEAFLYMPAGHCNLNFSSHGFAKVLASGQPDEVLNQLVEQFIPAGERDSYRKELEIIRRDKVCINRHDDRDYYCRIAAPVFSGDAFAGAIGITVLGEHSLEELEKLAEQVKLAAAEAAAKIATFNKP